MNKFLSCDWGTSSFRLHLVETGGLRILKTVSNTQQGVSAVHNLWKATRKAGSENRRRFYLGVVREHIERVERDMGSSLQGIPLILSGMASSAIGMAELPYGKLPFRTDGSDALSAWFDAGRDFNHPVLLLSGVRSDHDVMRGEETQLIGCLDGQQEEGETLLIFPGTHSKHVQVEDRRITAFTTYMTGEIFEVLSKKSILRLGVSENQDIRNLSCLDGFRRGVQQASETNLLEALFRVRTNDLFGKLTKTENFNYLSGLLIGTELQEVKRSAAAKKYVCCASDLVFWYEAAFKVLGLHEDVHIFSPQRAAEAVIRGHYKMYTQLNHIQ